MSVKTLLKSGVVLDLYFFKNNRLTFLSMLIWPYLTLGLILGMGYVFGSTKSFKQNVGMAVFYNSISGLLIQAGEKKAMREGAI